MLCGASRYHLGMVMRVVTDTRDAGKRAAFEGQKIELKDRSEIGDL